VTPKRISNFQTTALDLNDEIFRGRTTQGGDLLIATNLL